MKITKDNLLFHADRIRDIVASDDAALFINAAGELITKAFLSGGKLLVCGNGGSAADAQHMVAELVGTFHDRGRQPLPAISLTTNTSNITAISNDFSFDEVFSRQIDAIGKAGDILFCITTSGNSANILKGLEHAHRKAIKSIVLLGYQGGEVCHKGLADCMFIAHAHETSLVQECHLMIEHMICSFIDGSIGI